MPRLLPAACALALLCSGLPHVAFASSAFVPMGDRVREAAVVALADTRLDETDRLGLAFTLTLREILKGDPALAGRQITLRTIGTGSDEMVPREAKTFAVLLREDWESNRIPVVTVYEKPDEIEALRVLVAVEELPSERERLLALLDLRKDANPIYGVQLFRDLGRMREPDNFDLLTGLFAESDGPVQREVMKLIGDIGDLRGLPVLFEALDSPHPWLPNEAAHILRSRFRGYPGVTEAFRRVLESPRHESLQGTAESYLAAYDEEIAARIEAEREAERSDYQRATRLLQSGDEEAARPFFDLVLHDPDRAESLVRFYHRWVVRVVETEPEKADEIRTALLPTLTRLARSDSDLFATAVANVLSALPHADTEPLLLEILRAEHPLFDQSTRIAAYALADLGGGARRRALAKLEARSDWEALRPLFENVPDEGAHLVAMLESRLDSGTPEIALDWVAWRLGALGEERAVPALFRLITERSRVRPDIVTDALVRIGGERVEETAAGLLRHPDKARARRHAVEIVFCLQDGSALLLARRMLVEEDFGTRSEAARLLAVHGTPEDLGILIQLGDFWTGDRENIYWILLAISQIRQRYGLEAEEP